MTHHIGITCTANDIISRTTIEVHCRIATNRTFKTTAIKFTGITVVREIDRCMAIDRTTITTTKDLQGTAFCREIDSCIAFDSCFFAIATTKDSERSSKYVACISRNTIV